MKSLLPCLFLASAVLAQGADPETEPTPHWPSFRGTGARGIAVDHATASEWDVPTGKGVAWRVAVPGLAHSSPVIHGARIFLTSAVKVEGTALLSSLYGSQGYGAGESVEDEGAHRFQVLCFDKASGELLWERTAHTGVPRVKRHPKASHASPTPACDAEVVVAFFGSEGLHAFDHAGEPLWSVDFGVLNSGAPGNEDKDGYQWGFAASPLIHGEHVLVQCDVENTSFVAALERDTGREVWRRERDEDSTWCSPAVMTSEEGPTQVVLNGYKHIAGYRLTDGEQLWHLSGGGDVPVPTPVVAYGMVFLTSAHGREQPLRALYGDARGDLNSEEGRQYVAWNLPRAGIYMQTPLVFDGLVYACSDGGILGVYDALEGSEVYRERLGDGTTGFSASPVYADGKVYFSAENGEVIVVRAGSEFERLATNDLGETCMATPAISEGVLYFRTQGHLLAVAAP